MEEYAALIALDWSDTKHDGALLVEGQTRPEKFFLIQRSEAIEEWATSLRERFKGKPVAVILEQSKGALQNEAEIHKIMDSQGIPKFKPPPKFPRAPPDHPEPFDDLSPWE